MNPFRNRFIFFCSLIIYAILLSAILLYFRFPAKKFKTFCQTRMELLIPDTRCSISQIHYKIPFRVEFEDITWHSNEGNTQNLLHIDRLLVQPRLTAPGSHFAINIKAYDGNHSCTLLLKTKTKKIIFEDIQLKHLHLAKIPLLHQTLQRNITGVFSGTGSYRTTWNESLLSGTGQGNIQITDGSFELLFPILSLKKIDVKTFDADIILQGKSMHLNKGSFQGKELKGEFSGTLDVEQPIAHTELSFAGTLEPLPPLIRKSNYAKAMIRQLKKQHKRPTLPFLLQGSVQRPKFKFDS